MIPRHPLAPDFTISRILTGLWQVADMEREGEALDPEAAAEALRPYAEAGLTTFDMADHYGSAEVIAGAYQARYGRSGTEMLTKWVPPPGAIAPEVIRTAVQRALDRLQTDRLDLLQYHAWRYADPRWLDGLMGLQALAEEGLIRHLGLTNFDAAHLDLVCHTGLPVVTNQVCYSLLDRRAAGAMADVCQRHGVHLLTYGTLAGGFLTDRWLGRRAPDPTALSSWSEMKYHRFIEAAGGWTAYQHVLEAMAAVAQRHGVSVANVAARYVLDQPAVAGIIIGARPGGRQHLADNQRIFAFTLDDEDHARLADALTALHPLPGDCGDEYRRPPFLTASGDLSHHLDAFPPANLVADGPGGSQLAQSGTVWEDIGGFSRAVRNGDQVWVSGTTATHGDRRIGGDDAAAQMCFILDKIEGALEALGSGLADVVRTRIFVHDLADWEAVARVHGARFAAIRPANTLVQAGLVGAGYRVEVEVDAVVRAGA